MGKSTIRVAKPEDAAGLLAIYAPYVTDTAITFEYEVPSVEEFRERIKRILSKYPYLVAEKSGEMVGYAYASFFHQRAAYGWGVETTVYVRKDMRNIGVGRELYEVLERALQLQNILNLNACIAYPEVEDEYLTRNSMQFHEHLGYHWVGEHHKCGFKFNRWYNVVWMEKMLGEHTEKPAAVKSFNEIREELVDIH